MRQACIVCGRRTASARERRCSRHPLAPRPERGNVGKALREEVLSDAGYQCQLKLEGCTGRATTVHHKRRHREGGAFERGNLEAACVHCNSSEFPR